jgi:hypothetical protein
MGAKMKHLWGGGKRGAGGSHRQKTPTRSYFLPETPVVKRSKLSPHRRYLLLHSAYEMTFGPFELGIHLRRSIWSAMRNAPKSLSRIREGIVPVDCSAAVS